MKVPHSFIHTYIKLNISFQSEKCFLGWFYGLGWLAYNLGWLAYGFSYRLKSIKSVYFITSYNGSLMLVYWHLLNFLLLKQNTHSVKHSPIHHYECLCVRQCETMASTHTTSTEDCILVLSEYFDFNFEIFKL